MSTDELIHTAYYAAGFLALFALGELLYHVVKLPVEITRKLVHLFTGLICLSFPFVLETHWSVLILTVSFVVILVMSMRFNLLQSINAVDRKTRGSFLFPVVIYITFWIYTIYGKFNPAHCCIGSYPDRAFHLGGTIYYFLPILLLSVCDPLAAICGKRWPYGKYTFISETKTAVGSGAFFASALLINLIFIAPNSPAIGITIVVSLCIALATTITEAVSQKGFDNLFIPVVASVILVLFRHWLSI